jgi:hypothetical protein
MLVERELATGIMVVEHIASTWSVRRVEENEVTLLARC